MEIIEKEALRYLGYGKNKPDAQTVFLIQECISEIEKTAEYRSTSRRFNVKITEDDNVETAGITIHSRNLSKNLRGCEEVIFFAATLGAGVDRLMARYVKLNITKAAVLQATAAAAIEEFCNTCQRQIETKVSKEGLYVRPRFSPGYGDLPLSMQPDFLRVIGADRTVGITLTEGGVMVPEKSVTAIMGLSTENNKCLIEGCEACENINCAYRR